MDALKKHSKLLSIVLALAMIVSIFAIMPLAASAEETEALFIRFTESNYTKWFNSGQKMTVKYNEQEYQTTYLGKKDSNHYFGAVLPKGYDTQITVTINSSTGSKVVSKTISEARDGRSVLTLTAVGIFWLDDTPSFDFPPKTETTEPTTEKEPDLGETEALFIRFTESNYTKWFNSGQKMTVKYNEQEYQTTYLGEEDSAHYFGAVLPKGYDTPITVTINSSTGSKVVSKTTSQARDGKSVLTLTDVGIFWLDGTPSFDFPPKTETTEPTTEKEPVKTEPTTEKEPVKTEPTTEKEPDSGETEVLYLRMTDTQYDQNFKQGQTMYVTYKDKEYKVTDIGVESGFNYFGVLLPKGYDTPITVTIKTTSGTNNFTATTKNAREGKPTLMISPAMKLLTWIDVVPKIVFPPSTEPTTETEPVKTEPTTETEPDSGETEVLYLRMTDTQYDQNFNEGQTMYVTYNGKEYKVTDIGVESGYNYFGVLLPKGYDTPITVTIKTTSGTNKFNAITKNAREGKPTLMISPAMRLLTWIDVVPKIVFPPTTDPTKETEPVKTEPTSAPTTEKTEPTSAPTTEKTEPTTAPETQPNTQPSTSPSDYVEVLLGDAFSDGSVNIKDASYIQLYIASLLNVSESPIDLIAADIDDDGLNIKDVSYIQMWCASLKVDYKIGEVVQKEAKPVPDKPASKTVPEPIVAAEPEILYNKFA